MSSMSVPGTDRDEHPLVVGLADHGDGVNSACSITIERADESSRMTAYLTGEHIETVVLWLAHRGIVDLDALAATHRDDLASS